MTQNFSHLRKSKEIFNQPAWAGSTCSGSEVALQTALANERKQREMSGCSSIQVAIDLSLLPGQ